MSNKQSLGRFEVESPVSYESFPLAPAEGELKESAKKMREMMAVRPPGATNKRAVWIVHGMGQQVPFETLEQLAEGLIRAAEVRSKPMFREVRVGNTVLQRVELTLPRPNADPQEVHLYECYWAPMTEGAVQLRDVVSFLFGFGPGCKNRKHLRDGESESDCPIRTGASQYEIDPAQSLSSQTCDTRLSRPQLWCFFCCVRRKPASW